jgi:hypothetical protein
VQHEENQTGTLLPGVKDNTAGELLTGTLRPGVKDNTTGELLLHAAW